MFVCLTATDACGVFSFTGGVYVVCGTPKGWVDVAGAGLTSAEESHGVGAALQVLIYPGIQTSPGGHEYSELLDKLPTDLLSAFRGSFLQTPAQSHSLVSNTTRQRGCELPPYIYYKIN